MEVVDPSVPATWPRPALEFARAEAERLRGTTQFSLDLALSLDSENEFRDLMGDRVIAYHATRLMPHEVLDVRRKGLRRLTPELVSSRIDAAVKAAELTADQAAKARRGTVYAIKNQQHREHQVCFVIGRDVLDDDADGLVPLLSTWGGEAIRGGPDTTGAMTVGRPAIVVAALDLRPPQKLSSWTSLQKVCVGTLLGTESTGAELHYYSDIPGERIVDIWQPGHPEYDRHDGLSR